MMALHVVEAGETWSRIVIRYRVTSQALAAANPGVEQNQIKRGQILNIPIPPSAAVARSHRVGPGDTLRGIATRYNVTTDEIRRLNAMEDERVTMGETLLIPPARTAEGDGR
jgi:LysM repeat protein